LSEKHEYSFPCPHCQIKINFLVSSNQTSPDVVMEPQPPKPEAITADDHYESLPWKQSQKKSNLATILVTQEILENPTAKELFDKVKEWKTMKVGLVSYRYSKMPDGPEFLQRWSAVKLG